MLAGFAKPLPTVARACSSSPDPRALSPMRCCASSATPSCVPACRSAPRSRRHAFRRASQPHESRASTGASFAGSRSIATMMPPFKVAHLTTVDMSLRYLLLAQLRGVRDAGGQAIGISAPGPHVAELEQEGIRHIAIDTSTRALDPVADVATARELYRILRRERIDVLHTHNPKPGLYGRVIGKWANVPIIANTVHGLYATEHDAWRRRTAVYTLEAIASFCSDVELFQNPEDLALMQRLHLTRRAQLLGNGVDLVRFDASQVSTEQRRRLRAEFGATDDTVVVGAVG